MLILSVVDNTDPRAAALEAAMQAEYVEMYGEPDQDPDNSMYSAHGLVLAELDGEPVGIGAWGYWPDGDVKGKLLYVAPKARGRGIARAILEEKERLAAAEGGTYFKFEAGPSQENAHRIYDRMGYERLSEGFGFYKDNPGSVFFGKRIR